MAVIDYQMPDGLGCECRATLTILRSGIMGQLRSSPHSGCPLVAGAISLLVSAGGGLYWFVPLVTLGFVGAVGNAWVLLVEILR